MTPILAIADSEGNITLKEFQEKDAVSASYPAMSFG